MDTAHSPWRNLFAALLAGPAVVEESLLSAAVYSDPEIHRQEQEKLFRRLPLCLGAADQLRRPGDMLARDVAGVPLLLMRDGAGEIGVFHNACRHRGARLLAEQEKMCTRTSLTCRYHGWTYGADGNLAAYPQRAAFPTLDRATRGLRRFPSTVRHGLIWAVLDADAALPEMGRYLDRLDSELDALGLGAHKFFRQNAVRRAANWKLMIDAFLEVYHVKRLHAATLAPFFADSACAFDQIGAHQRMLAGRHDLPDLAGMALDALTPWRHGTLVHMVFPNTIIIYHPDYVSHIGAFPITPGESLFVHTMLVPEDSVDEKAQRHWDRSFDLIDRDVFNAEDLVICEEIQRGIGAGVREDFLLGGLEVGVRRFHAAIAEALHAVGTGHTPC